MHGSMNTAGVKEELRAVKDTLDRVLLRDRNHLNGLMRKVRQRLHDGKPADQMLEKLRAEHINALKRAQVRAGVTLKLDYPDILPISGKRKEIQRLIEENQVVIVCGTTGSGKTTQLPKIVVEAGAGKSGRIGVTQPRRLAATGMARRVAEEMAAEYARSEQQSKHAIQAAEGNLRRLKQQVDTVKVTDSVQKAQATIAQRHSGAESSMNTALASLERIKSKQAEQSARFEAAQELEQGASGNLQARLQAAGIQPGGSSGASVLARLRAQSKPALPSS